MDGKGFPGVAFGGARADARAAARGARGAVGPERGRGIEGRDRAWCGRGPALSALRELKGIVEADETYVLESRKGARGLGRKAPRRGGKAKKRGLSREQVPVLMAADRSGTTVSAVLPRVDAAALTAALDPVVAKDALLVSDGGASYPPCAAALGVSHEALNRSMGERVRGDLHVQTVNSRHSRLKDFLRPRRGIATRYLDNYLSWLHLVGLAPGANDRACLAAAVTR